MKNKVCSIYFFLSILVLQCGRNDVTDVNCGLNVTTLNSKLFLYFDKKTAKDCEYSLRSNYYSDVDSLWCAKLINSVLWVSLDQDVSNKDILFSYDDRVGNERQVYSIVPDWGGLGGDSLISRTIRVKLIYKLKDQGRTFFVLKFNEVAYFDVAERRIDAYLVYSSSEGFIGSYFIDPNYPTQILQKEGNILLDKIDYSSFVFSRVR